MFINCFKFLSIFCRHATKFSLSASWYQLQLTYHFISIKYCFALNYNFILLMQNKFKPYICSNTQIRKKQSFEATCQLRENYSTISPNCAPAVLRGANCKWNPKYSRSTCKLRNFTFTICARPIELGFSKQLESSSIFQGLVFSAFICPCINEI